MNAIMIARLLLVALVAHLLMPAANARPANSMTRIQVKTKNLKDDVIIISTLGSFQNALRLQTNGRATRQKINLRPLIGK